MNAYYNIKGILYSLTKPQVAELQTQFPRPDDNWPEYVQWIEENGKEQGTCQNLDS